MRLFTLVYEYVPIGRINVGQTRRRLKTCNAVYLLPMMTMLMIFNRSAFSNGVDTGRFIMFSVVTNIYNKKTKGPTSMELFTAAGKLKKVFLLQLEMFDVCTTGETAHVDTIFKFSPHTRQHVCIDILHCCNDSCL